MIGPALASQGGISRVEQLLINHWNNPTYHIEHLPTQCEGSFLRKLGFAVKAFIVFAFTLLRRKPDLVHIHFSARGSIYRKSLFILLAWLFRVRVVLHAHGPEFHLFFQKEIPAWVRSYVRFVLNRAAKLIVLGSGWQSFYRQIYTRSAPVILRNPTVIPEARAHKGEESIVFMAGRLGNRKGTYDLLAAYQSLCLRIPEARLWLAGDGELEEVRRIVHEHGWEEKVRIPGWLREEELREAYQSATIFVLPSYNEGLPMALLEAMAHGLPVITTAVGGIPELVRHGENGFLIQPGDIAGLTHYMEVLLRDSSLYERMSCNARKSVEKEYSIEEIIRRLSLIYNEVLSCDKTW